MGQTVFFAPRVGVGYQNGFNGLRTLVVGVAHMCGYSSCPHFQDCTQKGDAEQKTGVWKMDKECPCYVDREDNDYYRLSNSNEIELRSYLDGETGYEAYSAFTYYMLKEADWLTTKQKEEFWDNVAFTNLLQHFIGTNDGLPEASELYEAAYPAFKQVVETLKPQVIYAWNPNVRDCLKRHDADFRFIGKADMQSSLSVYIFAPMDGGVEGNALRNLRYERGVKSDVHRPAWYKKLVKDNLKRSFCWREHETNKAIDKLAEFLMEMYEFGRLGADEEHLYFRSTELYRWKGYHMVYLINELKRICQLGNGANEGFNKIFGEKAIERMPRSSKNAAKADKKMEEYLHRIIAAFQKEINDITGK